MGFDVVGMGGVGSRFKSALNAAKMPCSVVRVVAICCRELCRRDRVGELAGGRAPWPASETDAGNDTETEGAKHGEGSKEKEGDTSGPDPAARPASMRRLRPVQERGCVRAPLLRGRGDSGDAGAAERGRLRGRGLHAGDRVGVGKLAPVIPIENQTQNTPRKMGKLRTKPMNDKHRVECLGPGAVARPHTFEPKVSDGSERVCPRCRQMQDRMRTPPMILKCTKEPSWTNH